MRKRVHLLAAIATLGLTATGAQAMPASPGALRTALDTTNLVEQTAVFIVEGRRYCFYFDGWHGPGWYRCGFAWRRGLGWGGVYGWQGWEYGPAARRFSHREFRDGDRGRRDFRFREGRRDRDGFSPGVTTRERTTTRERSTSRGESTFRSRDEGGAMGRSRDNFRSEGSRGSFRSEGSRGPGGGSFTEGRGGEARGNMQMNASPPAARGGTEGRGGGAQMRSGGPGGGPQGGGARGGGPGGGPGGGDHR